MRLYCQADARLPAVMVDKERIEHVFDNLISNALRHTDRGGRITLGAKAAADCVKFSIEDTGDGIPAEHLGRIFDRFFRAPSSKRPGGAGLGLAIVREIITAHGGQIDVRSQVGAGTVFTFTLPTSDSPRQGAEHGDHSGDPCSQHSGNRMNTAKTILIVDDEPHVRLVFQIALESAGYTVVAAADGEEALARLREAPYRPDLARPENAGARRHGNPPPPARAGKPRPGGDHHGARQCRPTRCPR